MWTDRDSLDRYADHLRSTVTWTEGTAVQWPNYGAERDTLHAVAAEFGFFVKVRKGKAVLVKEGR